MTSDQIEFELRQVGAIDWSKNPKRLPFVCYLADSISSSQPSA